MGGGFQTFRFHPGFHYTLTQSHEGLSEGYKLLLMRKNLLCIFSLLIAFTVSAGYREGYYNLLDGKKREALKVAAKQCVQRHTTLVYSELPNYWQYSDVYPELYNGMKRWWDMYSDAIYLIKEGQTGKSSFSANKMQREHSVPKSWWKENGSVEYTPAYSDMWNLYPSDGAANQAKLNYPLGPVASAKYNNGVTKVGTTPVGFGGGSAYVFEPGDEYKGDFARAFFYMATVYDDINWVINYMFQKNDYPTLRDWAVNMLLDWARQDPVSQKEVDRNNVVEQYQGNRNPFVDFPELAEYIWGTRVTETFYVSQQPGSDPTPPVTGDPEITQPVNGESLDFGQTAQGETVTRVLQIVGKNLTEPLSVRIVASGENRGVFSAETTTIPAATMNQNQGYLLGITYAPSAIGKHEAKLTLYDGGLDASIAVTLTGEALERPELGVLTALAPVDVTDTGYTARWTEAPGVADYYIVTRVRTIDGNEESDSYETGETSYTFTDRDADVAESYYVRYSRLGLVSEASNSIYIAPGSGIEDMREESPLRILLLEGGFMARCEGERGGLVVTDISGRTVIAPTTVNDGDIFILPPGIYIVTAPGMRPVKIVVI